MAAAFSSTLYMYDAILSTFGSENKLCRVVNCKSGMAALNALVCGQFRSMCSSVWISPQGHRRASLGILLHLPVSIFSLCEDSLSLVNAFLLYSGTSRSYTSCCPMVGFRFT